MNQRWIMDKSWTNHRGIKEESWMKHRGICTRNWQWLLCFESFVALSDVLSSRALHPTGQRRGCSCGRPGGPSSPWTNGENMGKWWGKMMTTHGVLIITKCGYLIFRQIGSVETSRNQKPLQCKSLAPFESFLESDMLTLLQALSWPPRLCECHFVYTWQNR